MWRIDVLLLVFFTFSNVQRCVSVMIKAQLMNNLALHLWSSFIKTSLQVTREVEAPHIAGRLHIAWRSDHRGKAL